MYKKIQKKNQEIKKKPMLNAEQPIMYAQTSGTTGEPKYVPILKSTVKNYKYSQNIFAYAQYSTFPDIFFGKILAIVSPDIEGFLETGTPFGSMSGFIYKSMPSRTRKATTGRHGTSTLELTAKNPTSNIPASSRTPPRRTIALTWIGASNQLDR